MSPYENEGGLLSLFPSVLYTDTCLLGIIASKKGLKFSDVLHSTFAQNDLIRQWMLQMPSFN
jgi:hypothetical protein